MIAISIAISIGCHNDFFLALVVFIFSFKINGGLERRNSFAKFTLFMAFMTFSEAYIRYGFNISIDNSLKELTVFFLVDLIEIFNSKLL